MSNIQKYIRRVESAIEKAYFGITKLTEKQLALEGMSSNKNRIFLNEIIFPDTRYLEIGVWKGSTFVSAMYRNNPKMAIAIDNFSQFKGDEDIFLNACNENEISNFKCCNMDCFNLTDEAKQYIQDIDVYFYDGDHKEYDQQLALDYYINSLSKEFIFIVDDWNWQDVQIGTYKGILNNRLKIHSQWELPSAYNGDKEQWHNGFYVAVLEKV